MEEFPQEDLPRLVYLYDNAKDLQSQLETQKNEVNRLHPWTQSNSIDELSSFSWRSDDINPELRELANLTKVNYIPVITNYLTNALQVSGITREGRSYSDAWGRWVANEMPQKEKWLYKNCFNYAESVAIVKIGWDGHAQVKASNPLKVTVFKFDINDAFPSFAIEETNAKKGKYSIYDDRYIYHVTIKNGGKNAGIVIDGIESHGFTRCPVVSYLNEYDLVKETATGEVSPYINAQKLIFKTLWDAEATSHSQGFKVRYITGIELPDEEFDEDGNPITNRAKKYLAEVRMDSLIISPNKDARIGTLPETPIDGLLNNVEAAVQHLAAISTTPFYILQQTLSNISTDTAITATQNTRNKIADRQQRFGSAHRNLISLLMEAEGKYISPEEIQIVWKATDATQLAAYADAFGKIASQLKVPAKAFWNKLTDIGFTPEEIEYAHELAAQEEQANRAFNDAVIGSVSDQANAGLPEPTDEV